MQEIPAPLESPAVAARTRSEISVGILLPKRLVRELEADQSPRAVERTVQLFRYLFDTTAVIFPNLRSRQVEQPKKLLLRVDVNNRGGYFLREAVRLRCYPLMDLLLHVDANPWRKSGQAIRIAIGEPPAIQVSVSQLTPSP